MHARALEERRRDAIRIAEYAAWELGPLWDQYSGLLEPLTETGRACAACYIGPAGSTIAAWPAVGPAYDPRRGAALRNSFSL